MSSGTSKRLEPFASMLWARRRVAWHNIVALRQESRLKVAVVTCGAVLLWLGIYWVSHVGFGLFEVFGAELLGVGGLRLGDLIMARLLSVFALALFVLLIASNVVVAFQTLYRSREIPFLVVSPIPEDQVFLGRFVECVSMSSWASAYLGSPVLLAYGLASGAPPLFYAALAFFYLPFVVIPAALGTTLTLLATRFLAGRRQGPWWMVGGAFGLGLFFYFRSKFRVPDLANLSDLRALVETMGRTQSAFLPSHWAGGSL